MDNLAQEAISQALNGNWKEAVKLNEQILEKDSENIDALTRLARAWAELGNLSNAKKQCEKALKIDPYNLIASRSLEKWKGLRNTKVSDKVLKKGNSHKSTSIPQIFLEEPGKTKTTSLLYLGSWSEIAKLDSADEVKLDTHSHRVQVVTEDGKYIGRLPDDLSARIKYLMATGNEYAAYVKSISNNEVKVLLKETKRSAKMSDVPSFPGERIDYVSFTPPELVHKKEELEMHSKESDDQSQ